MAKRIYIKKERKPTDTGATEKISTFFKPSAAPSPRISTDDSATKHPRATPALRPMAVDLKQLVTPSCDDEEPPSKKRKTRHLVKPFANLDIDREILIEMPGKQSSGAPMRVDSPVKSVSPALSAVAATQNNTVVSKTLDSTIITNTSETYISTSSGPSEHVTQAFSQVPSTRTTQASLDCTPAAMPQLMFINSRWIFDGAPWKAVHSTPSITITSTLQSTKTVSQVGIATSSSTVTLSEKSETKTKVLTLEA